MIGVIQSGNSQAICNALNFLGVKHELVNNHFQCKEKSKLILPGVGHFDSCISNLRKSGMFETLIELAERGVPILGICVGMQMLFEGSEEGQERGLGLFSGKFKKFSRHFSTDRAFRVPHMGWNWVELKGESVLLKSKNDKFYFVHSYYMQNEVQYGKAFSNYGHVNFCSIVEKENIFGVQFHPEKSNKAGLNLLKNFSVI